jgi:3-oxoacyl-[acyl-carrier protein] reductase
VNATPTAVITGSTRGIGQAIALRLAHTGYNVVLNYATDDQAAADTLRLCQAITPNAVLVKADISNGHAVTDLIDQTIGAFGRIDLLVNNAARAIDKPAVELTESDWDDVLDVNLKGAFLCAQQAARHMLRQDTGGNIINIGASTGIRGRRNGANTCASKAGLMILTQCLALELGPTIRVNTVIPGLTLTDETQTRFGLSDPDTLRTREAAIPLSRIGQPEDVANAVMLLLADDAAFITGQKLVVDGGQYMW